MVEESGIYRYNFIFEFFKIFKTFFSNLEEFNLDTGRINETNSSLYVSTSFCPTNHESQIMDQIRSNLTFRTAKEIEVLNYYIELLQTNK